MMYQKGVFLLLLARSVVSFTFTNTQCPSQNLAFSRNTLSFTSLYSEISESESPVDEVKDVSEDPFKIYVGNLSYDFEQAQIEELFAPYGMVSECFVPTDKWTGKSRGFAFVTMADKASGEAAVQALDQSLVGDRTIKVNEQLTKEQLQQRPPKKSGRKDMDGTKIYVGNLPFDTEMEMINSMFTQFGTVKDCFLPTDRDTGRPRGFAFVTMEEGEAEAAIDALNGSDVGGRSIVVNKSLPRGESAPRTNRVNRVKLYVGNLSFTTEEDEVLSLFSEYGDVYDCYMPRDRDTGRPRGFAFVTMEEGDALNAEADCNGFEMDGRVLRVNQAQPKGPRNNDSYDGGFYDSDDSDDSQGGFYDNGSGSAWEDGY